MTSRTFPSLSSCCLCFSLTVPVWSQIFSLQGSYTLFTCMEMKVFLQTGTSAGSHQNNHYFHFSIPEIRTAGWRLFQFKLEMDWFYTGRSWEGNLSSPQAGFSTNASLHLRRQTSLDPVSYQFRPDLWIWEVELRFPFTMWTSGLEIKFLSKWEMCRNPAGRVEPQHAWGGAVFLACFGEEMFSSESSTRSRHWSSFHSAWLWVRWKPDFKGKITCMSSSVVSGEDVKSLKYVWTDVTSFSTQPSVWLALCPLISKHLTWI